jgi:hypothetical protein
MRVKRDFVSGFKAVARFAEAEYSIFQNFALESNAIIRAFHPKRGADRDRHERGMECDGRRCVAWRAARMRTAKACGPDAPGLVLSLQRQSAGDGD